ncbi:hypothetical protein BJY04DRAFT_215817 [Aspergillus karnatakaensis]|uniref:uncharacterized protein n=1 Tax=Aspergillus karnatakaensis TaxID=1810916 RepID=UPI003CCDCCF5
MKDLKSRLKQLTIGRRIKKGEGSDDLKQPEVVQQPEAVEQPEIDDRNSEAYAELWKTSQQFISEKRRGSLVFTISHATTPSPRITAHVHRFAEESGPKVVHSTEYSDRGFIKAEHPSFDLYRIQKKFLKRHSEEELDQEDFLLFDPEAYAYYEHESPGTVTVEGFGLDYWDAEIEFGRISADPFAFEVSDLPDISFEYATLLRRIDEIRSETQLALDPTERLAALTDCLGKAFWESTPGNWTNENVVKRLYDAFRQRGDVSAWTTISQSTTRFVRATGWEAWAFLVIMVTAKELALRLLELKQPVSGLSVPILALLTISDLWLQNTEIQLGEHIKLRKDVLDRQKEGITEEECEKAAELIRKANEASESGDIEAATILYQEAVSVNLSNYEPILKRAEWVLTLSNFRGAAGEAAVLKMLDPKRPAGYAILGRAFMGFESYAMARDAFRQAAQLATDDEKQALLAKAEEAGAADSAELQAIDSARDEKEKQGLIRSRRTTEWDPSGRALKLLPTKYERQLDGLVFFAERMKWPYLSEVRQTFERMYNEWLSDNKILLFEHLDWLYAVMRPGKHFAQIIMAALIDSTPSIEELGPALSNECGLVLPQCSYWRTRTVMGRVLGCLPEVTTLNGWIGPCTAPIKLISSKDTTLPHHCLVTAWYYNPRHMLLSPPSPNGIDLLTDQTQNKRLSDLEQITDPNEWVTITPPAKDNTTWELSLIELEYWKPLDSNNPNSVPLWNAYLSFNQLGTSLSFEYQLIYTPLFVTPPPCHPNPGLDGEGEEPAHKIHRRELALYSASEISVSQLHDFQSFWDPNTVIVINATGTGAEAVARAWCAVRQRSAVIRKRGGPCCTCAIRAASRYGLRTGVLIWVS